MTDEITAQLQAIADAAKQAREHAEAIVAKHRPQLAGPKTPKVAAKKRRRRTAAASKRVNRR